MNLKNVTLELSSKPFLDDSPEMMEQVCRRMYRQWKPLTDVADRISVLLWISDGSEILEFTGDLQQTFEWAYWCGCANPVPPRGDESARERVNTHHFPKKYREDAAPRSYAWLKDLIATIKQVGADMTDCDIRVGATFDNGPEFARSDFKFNRHREIAQGNTLYPGSFVTCNSTLHADTRAYAAFPDGIPEGTSLGAYLGAQFRALAEAVGYDYIWLSNGMGFGMETWGIKGALFDKQNFRPEEADAAAEAMLQFWREFTPQWPADKIETRGSNFSAGVELSTDAAPLKELYSEYKIAPPVNSPWAALNFNTGLELAAWMSHVAVLPGDYFPYRFYPHDPWFMNSPWLDRYGREPWDIYLPLSVCRLDESGRAQTPNSVAFLTIDDTLGRMPDQVPDEVIPHIKEALRHAPDQAGPLVWVYPFNEYTDLVRGAECRPDVVFNEDMFLGEAIQQGLPLNTVISSDNFRQLVAGGTGQFDASVIVAPVTAYDAVKGHIKQGGDVLFYGALAGAPQTLLELLGLEVGEAVDGEVEIQCIKDLDTCCDGSLAQRAYVHPQYSAGGLTEVFAAGRESGAEVIAQATQGAAGATRILAMTRAVSADQRIGFVRSLLPASDEIDPNSHHFDYAAKEEAFPVEKLMRAVLAKYHWHFAYEALAPDSIDPRICISREGNGFWYSIFAPDTSTSIQTSTPYGAPVLTEMETFVAAGRAQWHPGKCWHKECRCFVRQEAASVIRSKILFAAYPQYHDRRTYHGLQGADVIFYPPTEYLDTMEVVHTAQPASVEELLLQEPMAYELKTDASGTYIEIKDVTGSLSFSW
ncbi:hypothetical protein SH580_05385 [Coraliomargarita algicola]|uniref:Uncharacterized protein n=1 Tax=Coraliomargarita algicola TaxID=3092156 RepID=A0ABZ0RLQ2_9BACT|nr:hypothetical protein [Coraliomargarita sp. J2-16]WPJ97139.1 hypothetical protein SH580_05385 [Coraliomargarita sp. J2-16]